MDNTTRGLGDEGATGPSQPARSTSSGSRRSTTKGKRAPAEDAGLDRDTDVRTRQLQAEIAETREEMSETVEAIQEKLRPSNIMSEGTEAVKTAATERVRDMAETATDTAYDIVEATRQNPWPALMIGTGIAWLLLDRTRDDRRFETARYQSGRYRAGRYPAAEYPPSGTTLSRARRTSEDVDTWSGDWESGTGRGYGEQVRDTSRTLRTATKRAQTGLQRMLHENPLLVAAAAVLTGAAVGGALPQTEKENELMGETRDQVVERAQGAAREAADSVREVAQAVQHAAGQVTDTDQH
jgi:ElaB/YqjD/DUF883 family membrane-anchored ribosome-binding protein